MDADHFKTVVGADGSLVLSGLPPSQAVDVVVVERQGAQDEMQAWFQAVRTRPAFANMSKAEMLEILRQTRAAVWAEPQAS